MHSTQAILIRKTRMTESSLIVTWLSPEQGRFKTVAKGVLRPKNRLGGVLDLFHLCEIQFQPARSGDLHILKEAQLLQSFPQLRTEFTRVSLAAYAVELIERCTETQTPVPEVYDLLERALGFLNIHRASQKALRHFEAELARILGIANPGQSAEESLEALLQRLPPARAELLPRLPLNHLAQPPPA